MKTGKTAEQVAEMLVERLRDAGILSGISSGIVRGILADELTSDPEMTDDGNQNGRRSPFDEANERVEFPEIPEIPEALAYHVWALERMRLLCTVGGHYEQVMACQALLETTGKMMGQCEEDDDA